MREIQERLGDLAKEYNIEKHIAEQLLIESIRDYYKSNVVLIKSSGVTIDGRYINIKQKHFYNILDILDNKLIQESNKAIKQHMTTMLQLSDNILYAKHISTGKKYHYLQPFTKNKTPINTLILRADIEETIPKNINYFPLYVSLPLNKYKANIYRANCTLMNKKLLKQHAMNLEQKILKSLGINIKINAIGVNKKDRKVIISINKRVTKAILNYIKNYFKTFGYDTVLVKEK